MKKLSEYIRNESDLNFRKNMLGHVTASGIIINDDMEILLIYHNACKKYLQPGGHIDDNDINVQNAALREVFEETGLKNVTLHPWHEKNNSPINIDIHKINIRPEKKEDEHFHFDFMFIFKTSEKNINLQIEEVSDFKWISIENFSIYNIDNRHIKASIQKGLNRKLL